ncbi:dihydrolipoyl dehydrogenase [Peribacillus frigoritolerans]|jgi:dihydrolipoamide dehydrogenase|uniref:dihydrolipoyl dehydrogenase n=1 Tax=Peribacillus frigoritolerans TaxID=450367 RepID=UPI00215A6BE1|nr:dihydrolipoyl dehydrogenase [Peribacillus frigoritolerans]MCR8867679.1 dihydrolipoyl dehydrogenase [Peribacillus frigoritolerans]MCY9003926.1 dihydrolipoyl dehydrogenase [Peribacillus frigoritolerans]MED4631836.1 dihydrolipoyl dehydrogenase [Peribacillus frigoritolerans]MED4694343.1 dihydrolipoyl dehydrogenase [Peribacillus frigoritolerans]
MVVGEVAVETDVVIMGGGPGGYAAAIRLGQLGKSVVLVEKDKLGGVCLNRGCIPSKALIHAADQYHGLNDLGKMGIRLPQERTTMDLGVWQDWKGGIISQLGHGIAHLCKENGVTVVKGQATFLSDDRIGVETGGDFETYKFEQAIIATGSRPFIPSFIKVDGEYILDSTSSLQLNEVPASLSIIGGGYIGIELGMAFAKLGTKVTIIEMANRILPQVAENLVKDVTRNAKKLGINIKTSSRVEKASVVDGQVHLLVSSEEQGTEAVVSEKTLVTIGRIPNTEEIGLNRAGVTVGEKGHIAVDMECRTNVPHIFAIGDTTPGPALAHRASKQGIVAAEVIAGLPSAVDSPYVPYVIFSEPQIAGVGLSREEAEQQGYSVKVGKFPFSANGRALATNETEGFAEVIVDANSHILLGMHMVGADASNLIGEGVLALELAARVEDIALSMHPHPTLTEGWLEAAEAVLGHAIHIVNK